MALWDGFVELFLFGLMSLSTLYNGNIGFAILTLSSIARLIFLPLTIKLAYRTILNQRKLKELQPKLEKIKKLYRNNPEMLIRETIAFYKRNGLNIFDIKSFLGILIQSPVFMGIFSAVRRFVKPGNRFLWIGDLTRPDFILLVIVTALTYITSIINPNLSGHARGAMTWVPVILTAVFLWRLSASIGLYWAASNMVSIVQAAILRYKTRNL
jgi:YidC/Oxa1 family membrane protein insertase